MAEKVLLRETGKFLVQHVWEAVRTARRIDQALIATDHSRIVDAVRSFGGEAILTRTDHSSGTDRVAEVAQRLGGCPSDIVLNVQGDEPEIDPVGLDRLVERLEREPYEAWTGRDSGPRRSGCPMATLAAPFPEGLDPRAPSCVKLVMDHENRALYFSRALIPYPRDGAGARAAGRWLLHLGVYAYRRDFLLDLASWPPSMLEQVEKLEQLRVMENGCRIAVALVECASRGIDTAEDYDAFVSRWKARGRGPGG
jgi:3-deoxy-manno-octulosonate cytidylyltransferase (CMP-KDO synthetase)